MRSPQAPSRLLSVLSLMAFICVSVSGESVPSSAMETDSNATEKIEDGITRSWDEKINEMIGPATQSIESVVFWSIEIGEHSVPFVLVWLVLGAAVFTVYFKFINIRGFKLATDIVRGKYTNPKEQGEVSHRHHGRGVDLPEGCRHRLEGGHGNPRCHDEALRAAEFRARTDEGLPDGRGDGVCC